MKRYFALHSYSKWRIQIVALNITYIDWLKINRSIKLIISSTANCDAISNEKSSQTNLQVLFVSVFEEKKRKKEKLYTHDVMIFIACSSHGNISQLEKTKLTVWFCCVFVIASICRKKNEMENRFHEYGCNITAFNAHVELQQYQSTMFFFKY